MQTAIAVAIEGSTVECLAKTTDLENRLGRESKWQPLHGNRRMVRKSAKADGQRMSETDNPKSAKTSGKGAKTVENKRKQTKNVRKMIGAFC